MIQDYAHTKRNVVNVSWQICFRLLFYLTFFFIDLLCVDVVAFVLCRLCFLSFSFGLCQNSARFFLLSTGFICNIKFQFLLFLYSANELENMCPFRQHLNVKYFHFECCNLGCVVVGNEINIKLLQTIFYQLHFLIGNASIEAKKRAIWSDISSEIHHNYYELSKFIMKLGDKWSVCSQLAYIWA